MLSTFVLPNLLPVAPEIFLLTMACLILLLEASGLCRRIGLPGALLALFGAAILTVLTLPPRPLTTFGGMFVADLLAALLKLAVYASVATVLIYGRQFLAARHLDRVDYYLLTLFATLGMAVMISGGSFVTLYLGLEMLSLSLYALVAIDRDSARATEAAMKYFVLGALASGLLLYGMSMIYGSTGSLDLAHISQTLHAGIGTPQTALVLGLVFIVSGIAFKLGVVPFHMWVPDVYQGAPAPVTLMLAGAPKLAAFALTLRLLVGGLFAFVEHWQLMLLILAIASIGLGNLAAIAQTNIKRMLAYSGISHMGFVLLALASGVISPSSDSRELHALLLLNAYSSALYYAIAYVLMSMAAFGMVLMLSHNGIEAESIEDFKGLNRRSPWLAASMLMVMFSMAGIPFFIGFFAKFAALIALVKAGFMSLALIAVFFSLIGAFYYLRIVKFMYFDAPTDLPNPISPPTDFKFLLALNTLAIALFGLFPDTLMFLCWTALRFAIL
jgi:NADH-quinone oxidoreductase subunit N